jgi:hypothetical protein
MTLLTGAMHARSYVFYNTIESLRYMIRRSQTTTQLPLYCSHVCTRQTALAVVGRPSFTQCCADWHVLLLWMMGLSLWLILGCDTLSGVKLSRVEHMVKGHCLLSRVLRAV